MIGEFFSWYFGALVDFWGTALRLGLPQILLLILILMCLRRPRCRKCGDKSDDKSCCWTWGRARGRWPGMRGRWGRWGWYCCCRTECGCTCGKCCCNDGRACDMGAEDNVEAEAQADIEVEAEVVEETEVVEEAEAMEEAEVMEAEVMEAEVVEAEVAEEAEVQAEADDS